MIDTFDSKRVCMTMESLFNFRCSFYGAMLHRARYCYGMSASVYLWRWGIVIVMVGMLWI